MTRLLVVDAAFPEPATDAAAYRMLEHLRLLRSAGVEVLMASTQEPVTRGARQALAALGVTIVGTGRTPELLAEHVHSIDVALLCRPNDTLPLALWIRRAAPSVRIVYDTVDVHHVRLERRAAVVGTPEAARLAAVHRRVESLLVTAADCTIALHEADAAAVRALGARDVRVIPLVQEPVDVPVRRAGRTDLLWVGTSAHDANVDAVHLLVEEVLPRLRAQGFDGALRVVGTGWDGSPPAGGWPEGVVLTGRVDDLRPEHAVAAAAVLPLRWGGGMKGKVAMAMAHGVPVVTTPVGAEGFPASAGIVVVGDPAATADAVVGLCRDDEAWAARSAAGRAHVAAHLAPAVVRDALLAAVLG